MARQDQARLGLNGIQNHEDAFATLVAAAGMPDLGKELLTGKKLGDRTYKVHLDGFNNLAHWTEAGMQAWAVSDLNPAELQAFATLVRDRMVVAESAER